MNKVSIKENKYPIEVELGHICADKDKDPHSKCCGICISGFDECLCLSEWEVKQSKTDRFGRRIMVCQNCPNSPDVYPRMNRYLEVYIIENRITGQRLKICEGCTEPYFKYFKASLENKYLKLKDKYGNNK